MRRLSLINQSGFEQLLLKNPADYKSGFWTSYTVNGVLCIGASTESKSYGLKRLEASEGKLGVTLEHGPIENESPKMRFDIDLWSFNKPFLFMTHTSTNISGGKIEDLRVYSFMDLDVGGPKSYKDDVGKYDKDSGIMYVYDENPLYAAIASIPKPDAWTISSPTKLRVLEKQRDLDKTSELGPRDIAAGLQWNLGSLENNESKTLKVIISSADNQELLETRLEDGWKMFDKKLQ
jgi:hypothetical protein